MSPQGSSGISLVIGMTVRNRARADVIGDMTTDMTVRPYLPVRPHGLPLPGHPLMAHPGGPWPGGWAQWARRFTTEG